MDWAKEPTFYVLLQKRLLEKSNFSRCLNLHTLNFGIINMKIPKYILPVFLKEMERLKLVKCVGVEEYQIINTPKIMRIENRTKLYREHGIGLCSHK